MEADGEQISWTMTPSEGAAPYLHPVLQQRRNNNQTRSDCCPSGPSRWKLLLRTVTAIAAGIFVTPAAPRPGLRAPDGRQVGEPAAPWHPVATATLQKPRPRDQALRGCVVGLGTSGTTSV